MIGHSLDKLHRLFALQHMTQFTASDQNIFSLDEIRSVEMNWGQLRWSKVRWMIWTLVCVCVCVCVCVKHSSALWYVVSWQLVEHCQRLVLLLTAGANQTQCRDNVWVTRRKWMFWHVQQQHLCVWLTIIIEHICQLEVKLNKPQLHLCLNYYRDEKRWWYIWLVWWNFKVQLHHLYLT